MKKILSISLLLIFLMQILPAGHWYSLLGKNDFSVEMNDDADKQDTGKDGLDKEMKDKIMLEKSMLHYSKISVPVNLYILTSENAIILHHAEVGTPPPNCNA